MPSNESPAFDVLSAEENDLWNWAVERAGVENAATFIREAAVQAERARQIRCGGSDAGLAHGKLRKEYDALRGELDAAEQHVRILRESQTPEAEPMDADTERNLRERIGTLRKERDEARALLAERDTDLARARVEALTRCAVALEKDAYQHAARFVYAWMDREYPAPKPAECRLSDGSVVEWNEWETPQPHRTLDIVTNKGRAGCESRRCFKSLEDMRAFPLPYADWQLIDKAFAASRTEGTDGR